MARRPTIPPPTPKPMAKPLVLAPPLEEESFEALGTKTVSFDVPLTAGGPGEPGGLGEPGGPGSASVPLGQADAKTHAVAFADPAGQ